MATVFTYWLFAYKNSILQAHQRQDVVSKVTIVTDTCKYILQIGTLFAFHNYYYYVCVLLLSQIFNNILTAIVSNKLYPQYQAEGKLPKESVKKNQPENQRFVYFKIGLYDCKFGRYRGYFSFSGVGSTCNISELLLYH